MPRTDGVNPSELVKTLNVQYGVVDVNSNLFSFVIMQLEVESASAYPMIDLSTPRQVLPEPFVSLHASSATPHCCKPSELPESR